MKKNITEATIDKKIAVMKELLEHPWRKLVVKEIDKVMSDIKAKFWIPCSDQNFRFNAHNLITERITALHVIKNLPNMTLFDFEQIMKSDKEWVKPMEQRLEEYDKKLFNDLAKFMKL